MESLLLVRAFLQQEPELIERVYDTDAYFSFWGRVDIDLEWLRSGTTTALELLLTLKSWGGDIHFW